MNVWIRHTVAETIEAAFRERIGCETVNYFFTKCIRHPLLAETPCQMHHRTVWFGSGLIPFIRKVQANAIYWPQLFVTSSASKGGVAPWADDDDPDDPPDDPLGVDNWLWIGDVAPDNHMICCSDMWQWLWANIRDRACEAARR
jgi:hypothetical protein